MKTKHIGLTAILLAAVFTILIFLFFGQGCSSLNAYQIYAVILMQVTGLAVVFVVFLLLRARQKNALNIKKEKRSVKYARAKISQ